MTSAGAAVYDVQYLGRDGQLWWRGEQGRAMTCAIPKLASRSGSYKAKAGQQWSVRPTRPSTQAKVAVAGGGDVLQEP